MTPFIIFALVLGHVAADVVELKCSDNATCIENMTKELVRSLRQQKTVRLFDVLTVEPLGRTRQARSYQGPVARFLENHAFSLDWNDFSFRFAKPEQRSNAIQLEIFEGRSAKDVTELSPKKSSSKVEEEPQEKRPIRIRRRDKKVLQAIIPMVFGMKSAGTVIFAMAVVTALTIKAVLASKLALMVTVGMALKRWYENYGIGVGLQNHPYLYSQYPIDFPSASSHAYSVSGVSPQFASPELYNPTALASHTHTHEMLQQSDATAQQSQQAPTLQLANATRASERWDGKNLLQRFLEPLLDGVRTLTDPITNLFYNAMPATFRGLSSDVPKEGWHTEALSESASSVVEEKVKKPREYLVPQPRYIAQRKMANLRKRGSRNNRPKKYTQLNVDLNKLKRNKDFHDYIRTKKYKHNYPNTYYYPRLKYISNANPNVPIPNVNRLESYRKSSNAKNATENMNSENITFSTPLLNNTTENKTVIDDFNVGNFSDWQPIIINDYNTNSTVNQRFKRTKRDLFKYYVNDMKNNRNASKSNTNTARSLVSVTPSNEGRGFFDIFDILFSPSPMKKMIKKVDDYAKTVIKHSIKDEGPPKFYMVTYDFVVFGLHVMESLMNMKYALYKHMFGKRTKVKKIKKVPKPVACEVSVISDVLNPIGNLVDPPALGKSKHHKKKHHPIKC